jgi:Domain of unknown function (DUF397)
VADYVSARWQKSTYSMANGNCVELAKLPSGEIAVRDSKDKAGSVLRFSAVDWHAFVSRIKDSGFRP